MSVDELKRIISKTKIDFQRFLPGEDIATQGSKCGRMIVIIDGTVRCKADADDGTFAVGETLTAPFVLQVDGMFGLFQVFNCTYTAETMVSIIAIDKIELQKIASASVIFRINVFNSLSTTLQKIHNDIWRSVPTCISERIIFFFRWHCLTLSGPKTFYIKMQTLADIFHESRVTISHALNDMQRRGLVGLYRSRIEVPSMQALLNFKMS